MFGNHVQHGLDIRWRARNYPQDLAGRGLLLQRLGEVAVTILQFLKKPNVLNGDDGLASEGFKELDLLLQERTDNLSLNQNCPDRDSFA